MRKIRNWPPKINLISEKMQFDINQMESAYKNSNFDKWERLKKKNNLELDRIQILSYFLENKLNYCIFCEDQEEDLIISHFRPPTLQRSSLHDEMHEGYWWMSYEYFNHVCICKECDYSKSNYFPVIGKKINFENKEELKKEKRLIIDPRLDYPLAHIRFLDNGLIEGKSFKGSTTIQLLNLNRDSLVKKRLEHIKYIEDFIKNYPNKNFQSIFKACSQLGFHGLTESFLISKGINKKSKTSILGVAKNYNISSYKTGFKPKFLSSINIENFLGISRLDLNLINKEKDGTVSKTPIFLIGPNGNGKTSILKAIAFPFLTTDQQEHLLKTSILSDQLTDTYYQAKFENNWFYSFHYLNNEKRLIPHENTVSFNILAYGSNRLVKKRKSKIKINNNHITPLFDHWLGLQHSYLWCANEKLVNEKLFAQICITLEDAFDLPKGSVSRENSQFYILIGKTKIDFEKLSDGYKNIILIILDIMMNFSNEASDFSECDGLVLIDEIENHLHPSWKKSICSYLQKIFPKVQFIITTHDPLVLTSVSNPTIYKVKRTQNDLKIERITLPPGKNTDQILTGELFDLESSFDQDTTFLYKQYLSSLYTHNTNESLMLENKLRDRFGTFAETSLEKMAHQLIAENTQGRYPKISADEKRIMAEKIKSKLIG